MGEATVSFKGSDAMMSSQAMSVMARDRHANNEFGSVTKISSAQERMNQDSSIERVHYQQHLDSITSSISRRRNLDRISSRLEPIQRQ